MKKIFKEHLPIDVMELDADGVPYPVPAHVCTHASYDKKSQALIVEQWFTLECEWAAEQPRIAEFAPTREAALRRVIALADAWQARVQAMVPTELALVELPF